MWACAAAGAAVGAPVRAEELLYVVEQGRIVFTNVPESGARPVPGFEARRPAARRGSLPATVYDGYIERIAEEEGLPPELIKAVALVESGLDPHAVSSKGAQGLMQLMPATAQQYGVADAFEPVDNLRGGAQHLRALLDEFDGDVTLALAAYNAGSGAVRRHGGVPAYRETVDYVNRVRQRLGDARHVRAAPAAPADSGEIRVTQRADGTVLLAN
jgi:soluble lytic murein transglycosylase-like protein